jgi:site-specific DNA-methyltransferase (adenine-specific)
MNKDDAEEYTQSLGQVVGGAWRQIALAKRLGVPKALGLSTEEWVNKRLGGYVKTTVEDRRKAVAELAAEGASTREIAEVIGVNNATVHRDLAVANATESQAKEADSVANATAPLDAVAAISVTENALKSAERRQANEKREQKLKADLERPVAVELDGLVRGDFRELAKAIPDESVDLVFTDPPYDRESLPLYEAAAIEAARILKPGGSMVCYVGQILLPEALPAMAKHLRYWWTAACVHEGGNQIMRKYGVRCGWKPIMWFVKGTRGDINEVLIDTVSADREKDAHEWQQGEAEARYFINKLCTQQGTVVDFFAGGGTTCVAAEQLGRKWIAFEINAGHYESAAKRIMNRKEAA